MATVQPATAVFAGVNSPGIGNVTNGQFIELSFLTNPYFDLYGNSFTQTTPPPANLISQPLPVADNAWSGRLLTFLDGDAACRTTRIVGYFNDPTTNLVTLRILNFPGRDGTLLTDPTVLNGTRFVINGRPFNGTGVGYNPNPALAVNAPRLSTLETVGANDLQIALMPNAAFFDPTLVTGTGTENYFSAQWASLNATQQQNLANAMGFEGQGGSDESYDAADFQNMFLAWSPPSPQATVLANIADPDPNSLGSMVLPSFHRPALLNYWARQNDFLGSPEIHSPIRGWAWILQTPAYCGRFS